MAAALDHAGQCLSRAGDGTLHRPPRRRSGRRPGSHPAALSDAIERRRDAVLGCDRGRPHRAYAVLRSRRGRASERASSHATRSTPSSARSRHARHGRHQRRYRLHRGRRAAGSDRRRDRAPAGRRARTRHDHDLGRAAARSPGSTAADFSMSARRAPAPIPAPPAMGAAARSRRSPTPISSAATSIRTISSAALRDSTSRQRAIALATTIAGPLRMDVLAAAAGIQRIVDMRMADEVRVFAAKRGVDLSAFTLLPFGGAGAVHAAAVAEELGMRRILVPPRPGAFSALGLLCTDVVHDLHPLGAAAAGRDHGRSCRGHLPAIGGEGTRRARRPRA